MKEKINYYQEQKDREQKLREILEYHCGFNGDRTDLLDIINELEKWFDGIYCTNSYSDKENWTVEFGDISYTRQVGFINGKVKQLNVF